MQPAQRTHDMILLHLMSPFPREKEANDDGLHMSCSPRSLARMGEGTSHPTSHSHDRNPQLKATDDEGKDDARYDVRIREKKTVFDGTNCQSFGVRLDSYCVLLSGKGTLFNN